MYDTSTGRLLYELQSMAGMFPHVTMHGRELAELFTEEKVIRFRNLADGQPLGGAAEIRNAALVDSNSIAYSPTGKFLATNASMTTMDGSELWGHQGVFCRETGERVLEIAYDRIRTWLAADRFVVTDNGSVYDTATGMRVKPEQGRAVSFNRRDDCGRTVGSGFEQYPTS